MLLTQYHTESCSHSHDWLQENAEKQAELDRAVREKRAVEQELETVKFVIFE